MYQHSMNAPDEMRTLPEAEKKKMLEEATGVSEWIYAVIRKVCAE